MTTPQYATDSGDQSVFVQVREQDFSLDAENAFLQQMAEVGAVANFTGIVRQNSGAEKLLEMRLEHYPGMTERRIRELITEAKARWPLLAVRVIHRVGVLQVGDRIVYVGVSAAHRQAAFDACRFIMDFLKTEAPFWKKELFASGTSAWVQTRGSDQAAVRQWMK